MFDFIKKIFKKDKIEKETEYRPRPRPIPKSKGIPTDKTCTCQNVAQFLAPKSLYIFFLPIRDNLVPATDPGSLHHLQLIWLHH